MSHHKHKHSQQEKPSARQEPEDGPQEQKTEAPAPQNVLPPRSALAENAAVKKDELPSQGFGQAPAVRSILHNAFNQIEKVRFPMMKNFDELASVNKEAADVFVRSGTILAKGFEEISRQWMALAQNSVETNLAASKACFGVKSLKELMDLHADWMRHSFDTALSEATKISELSVKVANQAAEPIQSHFTNALSRAGQAAANQSEKAAA